MRFVSWFLMLAFMASTFIASTSIVSAQEPRPTSPVNATLVADSLIRLRWNPLSDASRYEVAIGWDSLFTLPTVQTLSATQNTLTIRRTSLPYVPAELTAFWRVRVRLDSVNVGAWSEVWRFTMPVPKTVPPIVVNQIQDRSLLIPTGQTPTIDRIELESPQWRPGQEEENGYVFIDPNLNKQSIPTSNTAISSRTGMSYTAISENPKRVSARVDMGDATVVNGAINPRPTLYYTLASSDNCQTTILVKVIATNLAGWTYPCFFQVTPRFGIGVVPVPSRQGGLILQAVDRFFFGQMPINQSTIASVPILTSSTATSGFLSVQATPGAEYSLSSTGTWQPSLRVDWRSGQPKLERLWLRYTPHSIGQNFPLIRYMVSDSCDDRQFRIEAIGMPPVSYAYTITSVRDAKALEPVLEAVYPNPTSSDVTFTFNLSKASRVKLTVCTTLGSILQTVADGAFAAGQHSLSWQSVGLPSGVYGYRLEVDGASVQSGFVSVVR